jgi:hypothetical protein
VDCPPLTARGKNAADIVMVMDIIDALEHSTKFEEFIILSGDADFTPVLSRLRAHDRRTAIFADSRTAASYRAVSDLVISLEDSSRMLWASRTKAPTQIRRRVRRRITIWQQIERLWPKFRQK